MAQIDKFEFKNKKLEIFVFNVILVSMLGYIDYITGIEISFAIFYLIPISIAAWYLGRNIAILFAVASAILWLYNELQFGLRYSNSAIPYWNAMVRFGFFMIVVFLMNLIHNLHHSLEGRIEERTADLTREILERKKTEDELKHQSNKLSRLTMRLQTIREEENLIISREIHDELGQSLTAMKIEINRIIKSKPENAAITQQLAGVSDSIDDTIQTIRKISTRLRPRLLDQLGFLSAVEWHIKDYQEHTGITCNLNVDNENFDLKSIDSNALFRIMQESLTNIARHSLATHVCVSIVTGTDGKLKMSIKDNGIGLSENALLKENSLGITGMNERALMMGGSLEIISQADGGTEVLVTAPLN